MLYCLMLLRFAKHCSKFFCLFSLHFRKRMYPKTLCFLAVSFAKTHFFPNSARKHRVFCVCFFFFPKKGAKTSKKNSAPSPSMCKSTKDSYFPHRRSYRKCQRRGGSQKPKFFMESIKPIWNSQKASHGKGMDIFWNNTVNGIYRHH